MANLKQELPAYMAACNRIALDLSKKWWARHESQLLFWASGCAASWP